MTRCSLTLAPLSGNSNERSLLVAAVVVALALAVVCVRDVRVVSASQSRELAASPPRRCRRDRRISLFNNTYSVLCFLALCALHFHFLSTPYLYSALSRVAARFVSRLSHFAGIRRAAAPFVNVRRIPTIDRAVASHLSRYALNLWAARQTRFYVISNFSLAFAPCLANSSPTPSGRVRRILLFHSITSSLLAWQSRSKILSPLLLATRIHNEKHIRPLGSR